MSTNSFPNPQLYSEKINPIHKANSIHYYFALIDLPTLTDDNNVSQNYSISEGSYSNNTLSYSLSVPEGYSIKNPNCFTRIALAQFTLQYDPTTQEHDAVDVQNITVKGTLVYKTDNGTETKDINPVSKPTKSTNLVDIPGKPSLDDADPKTYAIRHKQLKFDAINGVGYSRLDYFFVVFCKVPTSAEAPVSQYLGVGGNGTALLCSALPKNDPIITNSDFIVAAQLLEGNEQDPPQTVEYKGKSGTLIHLSLDNIPHNPCS